MSEIPYSEIDEGIRPLVKILNDAGFETFASCQGGEVHQFPLPVVMVDSKDCSTHQTRDALAHLLSDVYGSGYTVREIYQYQRNPESPWREWVEVELWDAEHLTKLVVV